MKVLKGWAGKRLCVDLNVQKVWTEEIPREDLESFLGGRGLNAKFFSEKNDLSGLSSSDRNPLVFGTGPLAGTFAPCSGWTSVSILSPYTDPPSYAQVSMPGHWGPQLKFAGFDQLIVQGKAESPIYLVIDGSTVKFRDARSLWRKDTSETMLKIYEGKEGRSVEVLCIGPAGERMIPFANVTNRFSWTADHIGLGAVFGSKNLKAITVRGNNPLLIDRPPLFLELSRTLRDRICRDPHGSDLREEGAFFFLGKNGGGLGIKNFNEVSSSDLEEKWKASYLKTFLCGREGCFSCPVHCGRVTRMGGDHFGGVHLEAAWSLGPRIGVNDWEWTLQLFRFCQRQGLDPCSAGSLLSWMMGSFDEKVLSEQDLENMECRWGDGEAALRVLHWIIREKGGGEGFRQGSLRAAKRLGKGLNQVAHCRGMDLPVRDPRSSMEYAVGLALFPEEWDYLRSIGPGDHSVSSGSRADDRGTAEHVSNIEDLKALADQTSLCPLVVARLPLMTPSDIADMMAAATGTDYRPETLLQKAKKTLDLERKLLGLTRDGEKGVSALPARFFERPLPDGSSLSKDFFEKEVSRFYQERGWPSPRGMEK